MANIAFCFKQGTFISVLSIHCVEIFMKLLTKYLLNEAMGYDLVLLFAIILVIFIKKTEYHKNIYCVLGKQDFKLISELGCISRIPFWKC